MPDEINKTPMKIWEETFRLRHSEVNRHANMKLETFFDYFQEVASNHASHLGCGYMQLKGKNQMWVLSRMKLEIARLPSIGSAIHVKTWPSGAKRLFAIREGLFHDGKGEVARATSYWVLLDLLRGRPLRMPEALPCQLPDNADMPQYFDLSEKITQPELNNPMDFLVTEHAIDVNGHMNNARYSSIAGDWLAANAGNTAAVSSIAVNFVTATPVGANLRTAGSLDENGAFHIEIASPGAGEEKPVVRFLAEGKLSGGVK